jgi:GxxExxY protein
LINDLTSSVIESAIKVHKELGPGLLESSNKECLSYELEQNSITFERQKPIPVNYKSIKLDAGYRIDILVENKVVVELKSIDVLAPIHTAQILTYLKFSEKKIGLLINFNVTKLKDGLKRYVL